MPKLSERTANFILRSLRRNLALPWCQKLLNRFQLPPTVHHHARYRQLTGDKAKIAELFGLLDDFKLMFNSTL